MAKPPDPGPPPRPDIAHLGERRAQMRGASSQESLASGGGPPQGPSMESRVAILETHMEYVRSDMRDIKANLAANTQILGQVSAELGRLSHELPTKKDLWEWKIQWTVMSLAAVALIVGGIIGGLDWIKTH